MSDRQKIIEATYIRPIRSVVAVDDEFPMLDKLIDIDGNADDENIELKWDENVSNKRENLSRLLEMMRYFRRRKWIVDVHDGNGIGVSSDGGLDIQHLHQSDLVILDYELKKNDDGEKSTFLINKLAENPHFNLVIIYSKNSTRGIFRKIRFSLIRSSEDLIGEFKKEIEKKWIGLSIESPEMKKLIEEKLINEDIYLICRDKMRRNKVSFPWEEIRNEPGICENISFLDDFCLKEKFSSEDFFKFLMVEFEKVSKIIKKEKSDVGDLSWSKEPEEKISGQNWIRTNKIFITIVKKTDNYSVDLVKKLKMALCDWRPTPVRLIASQIRAHMEQYGGVIEEDAISDTSTQAAWLHQILSSNNKADEELKLSVMLERQTSALHRKLEPLILPEAKRILGAERARKWGAERVIDHHFHLSLTAGGRVDRGKLEEIYRSLNIYECYIPVSGLNLKTGHILEHDGAFWICATPSCDLVPEQGKKSGSWRDEIGSDLMPVKVVRLHDDSDNLKNALKKINDGNHLFIEVRSEPKILKFTRSSGENPVWEQWFVKKEGIFQRKKRNVTILRLAKGNPRARTPHKRGPHLAEHRAVEVVAQLRYEYALNILHRLGANLSRVGLDFAKP